MHSADNKFFEQYKRLDKLCSEIYSERNGISEYITDMENQAELGRRYVSSWELDYKSLKHVRWVRNRLAHAVDSSRISESEDCDFVCDFYRRIMDSKDPLTLLRKTKEAEKRRVRRARRTIPTRQSAPSVTKQANTRREEPKTNYGLGVFIIAAAVLLLLYFLLCR